MPLVEDKYDSTKINRLRHLLQRESDKGRPKDYEIIIDGFKVVPRTNDINEFDDYSDEVNSDTREINILIYDTPNTNRNVRHCFTKNHISHKSLDGLGEVESLISQRLAENNREHELSLIREKLQQTEMQLEEAEEYADQLQAKISQLEEEKRTRHISWGELGANVLMGILKKNAGQMPELAGLLGAEASHPIVSEETTSSMSYQKVATDEATQHRLMLLEEMQRKLNEQQVIATINIIAHLCEHPNHIPQVISLLSEETHNT